MHDLPDDVERLPQLPSFHGNMAEDMQREMRNSVQRVVINQGRLIYLIIFLSGHFFVCKVISTLAFPFLLMM